jgi:hypothetical protein
MCQVKPKLPQISAVSKRNRQRSLHGAHGPYRFKLVDGRLRQLRFDPTPVGTRISFGPRREPTLILAIPRESAALVFVLTRSAGAAYHYF